MPEVSSWINIKVLRWARERLNLTTRQVEDESRKLARKHFTVITEKELNAFESGEVEPEMDHLETLSEIYECPVGWFFLDFPPKENLPLSFRGLLKPKNELGSLSQRTLRRFTELAHWTVEIIRQTGHPWQVKINPGQESPRIENAEKVAKKYREYFKWDSETRSKFGGKPQEAFRWWRRSIESLGVFCFEMPLNPEETRGAAMWLEGYPFILVNKSDFESIQGRLFTLLHEFAHLISSKGGLVCDFQCGDSTHSPEPFANRVAACILVTPEELIKRLKEIGEFEFKNEWSDYLLDKLRKPFFASRDVIAILLQKMQLAPDDFYEKKREEWKKRKPWGRGGKRPSLNEQKIEEIGYSLAKVLAEIGKTSSFSYSDASSVLGLKVERVDDFLEWTRDNVR